MQGSEAKVGAKMCTYEKSGLGAMPTSAVINFLLID